MSITEHRLEHQFIRSARGPAVALKNNATQTIAIDTRDGTVSYCTARWCAAEFTMSTAKRPREGGAKPKKRYRSVRDTSCIYVMLKHSRSDGLHRMALLSGGKGPLTGRESGLAA
jgi:hypothetical protein